MPAVDAGTPLLMRTKPVLHGAERLEMIFSLGHDGAHRLLGLVRSISFKRREDPRVHPVDRNRRRLDIDEFSIACLVAARK